MSMTEDRSSDASGTKNAGGVDMKLEVIVLPVSDVDRAKEFYERLGWRLDADRAAEGFRLIQFTPPGSGCSVQFGTNLTSADATIHLHQRTTATPEQFLAGLTDFGPGRSKIFPNSADGYLKVHDRGPGQADVTEGSGGIWERLHYDWSDPHRITMTTTDSNVWGGRSGHTYTLTPRPDGTTDADAVVVREGKNLKGRLLAILLSTGGKRVLGKALAKTVKAIEAQNYQTTAGNS